MSAIAVPPVRRKRRSSDEIRARILDAAGDAFERYGFAGATTAAIASAADVTEAQLFRYFATKSDLFRDAIFKPLDEHFSAFRSRNVGDAGEVDSSREMARHYIAELQTFLGSHSRMLMSMIVAETYASSNQQSARSFDSLNAYFDRGAAMMAQRLGEGVRVDPQLMVRVSFAAVLACVTFKDWIFPPGIASDHDIAAAVREFVMDGINANAENVQEHTGHAHTGEEKND
jgi:AcrR family transcriptional regulator